MFAKYQLISIIFNKFLFILPGMDPTGLSGIRTGLVRIANSWSSEALNRLQKQLNTFPALFNFSLPLNRPKQSFALFRSRSPLLTPFTVLTHAPRLTTFSFVKQNRFKRMKAILLHKNMCKLVTTKICSFERSLRRSLAIERLITRLSLVGSLKLLQFQSSKFRAQIRASVRRQSTFGVQTCKRDAAILSHRTVGLFLLLFAPLALVTQT